MAGVQLRQRALQGMQNHSPEERGRVDGLEAGSFRDRRGRVFYRDQDVFRALDAVALNHFERLSDTEFFREAVRSRKIIATERIVGEIAPDGAAWAGILRHERIPFVSYPYEWTFGMLQDAALLQLDLLLGALDEGFTLKDASPFNVQWLGTHPIFIDVPSFEPLRPGEPWTGYRQFCQLCLYPLLLQAYRGVPFQPWLRGHIDGIDSAEIGALLRGRDLFRPGVFLHVHLQRRFEARYGARPDDVRVTLREAGFGAEMIRTNVRRLKALVERLSWTPPSTAWAAYAGSTSYDRQDEARKAEFVRRAAGARRRKLVWDLGANVGAFSRIAAESSEAVVAMDADAAAVARLYTDLRAEGSQRILPLQVNLVDPSPNLGWRGTERKNLPSRGRPDLLLALALVHHLVIGGNVPTGELVEWLADLGAETVVEFVDRDDEMVSHLLRNKEDLYQDYSRELFERLLMERFEVLAEQTLKSGKRILYHLRPRAS